LRTNRDGAGERMVCEVHGDEIFEEREGGSGIDVARRIMCSGTGGFLGDTRIASNMDDLARIPSTGKF